MEGRHELCFGDAAPTVLTLNLLHACVKSVVPRICRNAMYAAAGRLYVEAPEKSPYGVGSDGATVQKVAPDA